MIKRKLIDEGLSKAKHFIIDKRSTDGLWRDFSTLAGKSTDWVTGFVSYSLFVSRGKYNFDEQIYKRLLYRQRINGGWGYNRKVPSDCDSTAWVLIALASEPQWKPSALLRGINYIKRHQEIESGGFTTYNPQDGIEKYIEVFELEKVKGWTQAHPSVSAIAIQTIIYYGENLNSSTLVNSIKYLLMKRDDSGLWFCYWWKGYAYPTYQSLKALLCAQALSINFYKKTADFLILNQKS